MRRSRFVQCQLCQRTLEVHEQPEGYCDSCLRANQAQPSLQRKESRDD